MYFQYRSIHLPVCQLPIRVYWVRDLTKALVYLVYFNAAKCFITGAGVRVQY